MSRSVRRCEAVAVACLLSSAPTPDHAEFPVTSLIEMLVGAPSPGPIIEAAKLGVRFWQGPPETRLLTLLHHDFGKRAGLSRDRFWAWQTDKKLMDALAPVLSGAAVPDEQTAAKLAELIAVKLIETDPADRPALALEIAHAALLAPASVLRTEEKTSYLLEGSQRDGRRLAEMQETVEQAHDGISRVLRSLGADDDDVVRALITDPLRHAGVEQRAAGGAARRLRQTRRGGRGAAGGGRGAAFPRPTRAGRGLRHPRRRIADERRRASSCARVAARGGVGAAGPRTAGFCPFAAVDVAPPAVRRRRGSPMPSARRSIGPSSMTPPRRWPRPPAARLREHGALVGGRRGRSNAPLLGRSTSWPPNPWPTWSLTTVLAPASRACWR